MKFFVSTSMLSRCGKFLDDTLNPIAVAIADQLPLKDIRVHQNRVTALNMESQLVQFKVRPAFTPKNYNDLLQENKLIETYELIPL